MQRHTFVLCALATLAVTSTAVQSAAQGQSAPDARAAGALEARATRQLDVKRDLGRAANLFVRAASLRGATDPLGVADLTGAANAYYLNGQRARARVISVQAGERALAMGDVEEAAHAFVYAALVAHQQRDAAGRDSLINRAYRLSASPLLSRAQQASIRSQFTQAIQVAGAEK